MSGGTSQPFREPRSGLVFPSRLGGMGRIKIDDMEPANPGLGTMIRYETGGVWADVFVYDLGLKGIRDGVEASEVVAQAQKAEADIRTAEARGMYRSVQKLGHGRISLGGTPSDPPALWAKFSLVQEGTPLVSHLMVLGTRRHFLKIRFSYPDARRADAEARLPLFLEGVGQLLIS